MIMEKMNYMTPVIEIIDIEVEQAVLSASTEELGVKSPDLEW